MKNFNFLQPFFMGIILLLIPIVASAQTSNLNNISFNDVSEDYIYKENIYSLVSLGAVHGFEDGTFRPEQEINRAEFIKILMSIHFNDDINGANCFPDINLQWFASYVCSAKNLNFVKGYEDGLFHPEKNINFVEASKILAIAFKLNLDSNFTENWYQPYVKAIEAKGAIPVTVGEFGQILDRSEAAAMMSIIKFGGSRNFARSYDNLKNSNKGNYYKGFFGFDVDTNDIPADFDFKTFKELLTPTVGAGGDIAGSGLYKDRNNVYRVDVRGTLMTLNVDTETFESIPTQGEDTENIIFYFKDKSHVYSASDFKMIEFADPKTFEVFSINYGIVMEPYYFIYGKNKDDFWYFDRLSKSEIVIKDIDIKSFELITTFEYSKIPDDNLERSTFHYIDPEICNEISKNFSVDGFKKIDENEVTKFIKLEDQTCLLVNEIYNLDYKDWYNGFVAKDKQNVFIFLSEDNQLKIFQDADSASFQSLTKGDQPGWFFKDKNMVYYLSQGTLNRLEFLETETTKVEFFNDEIYLKDTNAVWKCEYDYKNDKCNFTEIINVDPENYFDQ